MNDEDYEELCALWRALNSAHGPNYVLTDPMTGQKIDVVQSLDAIIDMLDVVQEDTEDEING